VRKKDKRLSELLKERQAGVRDFGTLSRGISDLCEKEDRKIVLLIDEVDQSSNSKVFLLFLRLLRNKYLAAKNGDDLTFQSVILAGLHDVKNLKLAIRDEVEAINEKRFNSPWNIAVKYNVDMSFSASDIETMLREYSEAEGNAFDVPEVAKRIHEWTSGYPYLVSDICQTIYQRFAQDFSEQGVENAVKLILNEPSTLFDDVIKNVANNQKIADVVQKILFNGGKTAFNFYEYEQGILYGIFKEQDGRVAIGNRVFESLLYAYLLAGMERRDESRSLTTVMKSQFTETGKLDMARVLTKFRER